MLAIGGIGGSGTRAIAKLAAQAGADMGADLNDSLDHLGFTALFKRHALFPTERNQDALREALTLYLQSRGLDVFDADTTTTPAHTPATGPTPTPTPTTTPRTTRTARLNHFLSQLPESSAAEANCEWQNTEWLEERIGRLADVTASPQLTGWKEPNTHVTLPYLLAALPNLHYVHVIRHGLDMAFSSNVAQVRLWGALLSGNTLDADKPADRFTYWCAVHRRLATVATQFPGRVSVCPIDQGRDTVKERLLPVLSALGLSANSTCNSTCDGACNGACNSASNSACDGACNSSCDSAFDIDPPSTTGRYAREAPFALTHEQVALLEAYGYQTRW